MEELEKFEKPVGLKELLIEVDSFGVNFDLDSCLKKIENLKFPWHKSNLELDGMVTELNDKLKKN